MPDTVVIAPVVECPAPAAPDLPVMDGSVPLGHQNNVEAMILRDDLIRAYIQGLRACVNCYQTQVNATSTRRKDAR